MKKRVAILLTLFMLVAFVAGCGGPGKDPVAPADTTTTPAATSTQNVGAGTSIEEAASQSDTSQAAADKTGLPVSNKSISISFSENCITLDPHDGPNSGTGIVQNMYNERLIITDNAGTYYPWLATDWTYSEDGKEWIFNLRQDVTFSNGEPFDADDVVCTYQRYIDEYTALNGPKSSFPLDENGDSLLVSIEKLSQYQVKIVLNRTYATVLSSFSNVSIIPNETFAKEGPAMWANQNCVATGPWVLQEWIDGQYARFAKNPTYWNKANYDPYYDEVYIRCVLEPSSAAAAHISGDTVANIVAGGIDPDMLALYAGTESKTQLISYYVNSYYYMGFNCAEDRPFYDINMRRAFEYAIDRQAICDAIMGGGVAINSVIPEGIIGYDADLPNYEYDVEKAKECLAAANYDGREITLSSNTSTTKAQDQLLAMQGYLEEAGFKIRVEVVENATLLEMRTSGNYDAFLVITMHTASDAGSILYMRVGSVVDYHKHSFVNEELNALILKGNETVDDVERGKIYQQVAKIMREVSGPHYALYAPNATQAIDYGIVGLELWVSGNHCFRFVDFDPDATAWRTCDWEQLTNW